MVTWTRNHSICSSIASSIDWTPAGSMDQPITHHRRDRACVFFGFLFDEIINFDAYPRRVARRRWCHPWWLSLLFCILMIMLLFFRSRFMVLFRCFGDQSIIELIRIWNCGANSTIVRTPSNSRSFYFLIWIYHHRSNFSDIVTSFFHTINYGSKFKRTYTTMFTTICDLTVHAFRRPILLNANVDFWFSTRWLFASRIGLIF